MLIELCVYIMYLKEKTDKTQMKLRDRHGCYIKKEKKIQLKINLLSSVVQTYVKYENLDIQIINWANNEGVGDM